MASSDEFVCHRSVRLLDTFIGVVISILLHSILLVGSKYWHKGLMREPKQEITQEIPIEVVEVPAKKVDIPPQTSFRASKDSIAGGKALPERPVSVVKSANLARDKASSKSSFDLASSPLNVFQLGRQQKTESPKLSHQQLQLKPQKTASVSASKIQVTKSKKIAVVPMTTPLALPLLKKAPLTTPLRFKANLIPSAPATAARVANSKKIAVSPKVTPFSAPLLKTAPLTTQEALNSKQTTSALITAAGVANSKKIAIVPITTSSPVPLRKTAPDRTTTLPVPNNLKNLGQSRTKLSGGIASQSQSSLKTGAASLLGGTVGVSSQNYRGDQLAVVPNSNRDRIGTSGVDASSQDVDLTSYLNKLKKRVQQQWLPVMSQSNQRTVLYFTINRSGQVSNLNIARSSGFSVTDEVALNAIQKAAPFAPLPIGYPKNQIDIEFTFDINVDGELSTALH